MNYITIFELGLTALALFITALNWFISQRLISFDERINRLETSYNQIHNIHLDLELYKQKLDLVISMLQNNKS